MRTTKRACITVPLALACALPVVAFSGCDEGGGGTSQVEMAPIDKKANDGAQNGMMEFMKAKGQGKGKSAAKATAPPKTP